MIASTNGVAFKQIISNIRNTGFEIEPNKRHEGFQNRKRVSIKRIFAEK